MYTKVWIAYTSDIKPYLEMSARIAETWLTNIKRQQITITNTRFYWLNRNIKEWMIYIYTGLTGIYKIKIYIYDIEKDFNQ